MGSLYGIPMALVWAMLVGMMLTILIGVPALLVILILNLPPNVALISLIGVFCLYAGFGAGSSRPH